MEKSKIEKFLNSPSNSEFLLKKEILIREIGNSNTQLLDLINKEDLPHTLREKLIKINKNSTELSNISGWYENTGVDLLESSLAGREPTFPEGGYNDCYKKLYIRMLSYHLRNSDTISEIAQDLSTISPQSISENLSNQIILINENSTFIRMIVEFLKSLL